MSAPDDQGERALILSEIKRIAAEMGRAPGMEVFAKNTGIGKHRWYGRYWPRWSDALSEAGLDSNELQGSYDSVKLLELMADQVRKHQRLPTEAELKMARRRGEDVPHPEAFRRHFGSHEGTKAALTEFCQVHIEHSDILPLIPASDDKPTTGKLKLGHVYLLRSGNHYKIGRTDTLERRIKEISVALPEKVTLEHAIATDDPVGIEAYWHRRFADRRANGEWFKLTRDDLIAFRRRKFQ